MNHFITCELCSKQFKIITSAHLKSAHHITVDQYKRQFNVSSLVCEQILHSWRLSRTKNREPIIRDESNSVKCLICGQFHKGLTLHLKYKHSLSPVQYKSQFPNAEIFSKTVKTQMSDNSAQSKLKGISFDDRYGKDRADRLKDQLKNNAIKNQTGKPRSEAFKQNIKNTWSKKRTEWTESIKRSANTPERKAKQSAIQIERINKNGYHLAWGKETKLEKAVKEALHLLGYETVKQKGLVKDGKTRFYDLFIPSLNVLVEADGEYWHRKPDRIMIDEEKEELAATLGFQVLRISDVELNRQSDKIQYIKDLLNLSSLEKSNHNLAIINNRKLLVNLNS